MIGIFMGYVRPLDISKNSVKILRMQLRHTPSDLSMISAEILRMTVIFKGWLRHLTD